MRLADPIQKTILVVEDDHNTRVSVRPTFECEGCIKSPCLILLDIIMPITNGKELLGKLEKDPALHKVPAIAVFAFLQYTKRLVVNAFVQKPIELQSFLRLVAEQMPRPPGRPPTKVHLKTS